MLQSADSVVALATTKAGREPPSGGAGRSPPVRTSAGRPALAMRPRHRRRLSTTAVYPHIRVSGIGRQKPQAPQLLAAPASILVPKVGVEPTWGVTPHDFESHKVTIAHHRRLPAMPVPPAFSCLALATSTADQRRSAGSSFAVSFAEGEGRRPPTKRSRADDGPRPPTEAARVLIPELDAGLGQSFHYLASRPIKTRILPEVF